MKRKKNYKYKKAAEVKVTKTAALKAIKNKFGNRGPDDFVGGLCGTIPLKLRAKWNQKWDNMNVENRVYMSGYLYDGSSYCGSTPEVTILRLLTLHMFIEDNY